MLRMGKSQNLNFLKFAEFEFLVGFKTEEEEQFQQLLARLNSIDNAIQSHLESELQQPSLSLPRIWAILRRGGRKLFTSILGY